MTEHDSRPQHQINQQGPMPAGLTLEPGDTARLADALHDVEGIAMSTLSRLDDEAAGTIDPDDGPLSDNLVELLHALFDAFDLVERAGVAPVYPEWREVRDRDRDKTLS